MKKIIVAGAGFSGAVIARELALNGYKVHVYESRNHTGGNCYTEKDSETGILIHKYGPHIFHTDKKYIWDYLLQFDEFSSYTNRVKAMAKGKIYSFPINLMTINQFFNMAMTPKEAASFLEMKSIKFQAPIKSFEEQALSYVGEELYECFFKGYTIKQWGIHPKELPASILKRLPIRMNYDDNYYNHQYQGIPLNGYGYIIEKILNHPNITVTLNTAIDQTALSFCDHLFWTGPIDTFYNYKYGKLPYRTLDFIKETHEGDYQGCAVVNYCDEDVPYTRISEHKHFSPHATFDKTIIYKEYSRDCQEGDIPYYPLHLVNTEENLTQYLDIANKERHVSFVGRLGTYRYLDMDTTIDEALKAVNLFLIKEKMNEPSYVY